MPWHSRDASPALTAESGCRPGSCGRRRGRRSGCQSPTCMGCEHEGGPIVDGDGELYQEAAPWRALHVKEQRACSADRDGLVGLRVARHGCAAAEARIVEQGLDDQVSRPAGREEQADQGDPSPDQTCRRCPRWSRHGRVGRSRWWTCRAVRGEPHGYGGRANKPRAALVTDPLVAFMRYWPMVMACPCSASVLCAGGGQPLVEPDGLVSVGTVRGEQRDG